MFRLVYSPLVIIIFFVVSQQVFSQDPVSNPNTLPNGATVVMKAWDKATNTALDAKYPVYFALKNRAWETPELKRHAGWLQTNFLAVKDPESFVGIHYPDGLKVEYKSKFTSSGNCALPTYQNVWHPYDEVGGKFQDNDPLQIGKHNISQLTDGSCLVIYFRFDGSTSSSYPGYLPTYDSNGPTNMSLDLSVIENGQGMFEDPDVKTMQQGVAGGGKFEIIISEDFGGKPKIYFGKNDNFAADKEELAFNGNVATDLGYQFSFYAHRFLKGLYSFSEPADGFILPNNMMAGHDTGGSYMWGIHNPLEAISGPNNLVGFRTKPSIWVPMYSDELKDNDNNSLSPFEGSNPLFRSRPARAFDSRFEEFSLEKFSNNGADIQKLNWDYKFRVHRSFRQEGAVGWVWSAPIFNNVIKRTTLSQHDAVVYFVWTDDKVTGYKINSQSCDSFRAFVRKDVNTINCNNNDNGVASVFFDPTDSNHPYALKKMIVDFRDKGLALVEQPDDPNAYFNFLRTADFFNYPGGTEYFGFGTSISGVSASNSGPTQYYLKGAQLDENRDFFLASMSHLFSAGVGLPHPFTVEAEDSSRVTKHLNWLEQPHNNNSGGNAIWSNIVGAYIETEIVGDKVQLLVSKDSNRGMAKVYIDGIEVQTLDLYQPNYEAQVPININVPGGLKTGSHTVKIEVLWEKNPASPNRVVLIDKISGIVQ